MKITKYISRKRIQKGSRRKSRKNKQFVEEKDEKTYSSEKTNNDVGNNKENLENVNIKEDLINNNYENLNDINNLNLLVSQKDINKISEDMPTFNFDNYKYDLLKSNPEQQQLSNVLNKNPVKILDNKKNKSNDTDIQLPQPTLSPEEKKLFDSQVSKNIQMSQPTLSPEEKKLFDSQVSNNIQMSQPTLSPEEKKLFDSQVSNNIQMSQPTLSPEEKKLFDSQVSKNIQMSQPTLSPEEKKLFDSQVSKNIQMSQPIEKEQVVQRHHFRDFQKQPNYMNIQMSPLIQKKQLNQPSKYRNVQMFPRVQKKQLVEIPNYRNVQIYPQFKENNQRNNYLKNVNDDDILNIHSEEIENFEKIGNIGRDFYLEIRDKKIIKIINDSEIFSKYCRNNKVSKKDIIAAINTNYYRVIESINNTNIKIRNDYNYEHLISLFNTNVTMLWSRISFNLLKKFYIYITELIV